VLRDGIAATAAGHHVAFADVAAADLALLLGREPGVHDLDEAVAHVLAGLDTLDVHPDVPPALEALRDAGVTTATLTNGSVALTESLLRRAGLLGLVAHRLDVAGAGRWKPHPAAYRFALDRLGVPAADAALVAVHPWDLDGAARVGLRTGWADRHGDRWPAPLSAPTVTGGDLASTVDALLAVA
jgi:2-haloacid dehalogenase